MRAEIDAWGIQRRYEDAGGRVREVSDETVARLRERIGEPRREPPVLVTRPGQQRQIGTGKLALEDGTLRDVRGRLPPDLPLGYHTLHVGAGAPRRLIVSPGRCHLPQGWRAWGFSTQLYAMRSRRSWGMGDLRDLAELAAWSKREHGAGLVLVNPLHAVAPAGPQQPSPYFPATRRFHNPIYLCVEEVPGAGDAGAELEAAAAAGRALDRERVIDRDAVWRLKRTALEAVWASRGGGDAFEGWLADRSGELEPFATWCALVEERGPRWRGWPAAFRDPASPDVAHFRHERRDRVRFHAWLQWLCEQQLARAAREVAVIQDLPVGVDPDGADAWLWQDVLAAGVTTGAPPDEFNTQGQDWGLPPFVPWRLQEHGYQPFIDAIRDTIAVAGGLRVDHAMGLFRLWWIPEGASPAEGAYVRYPAGDLLDIVALESHRARAVVVGEDLGTVEEGVREAMAERNMLSYRLLWFEEDAPEGWPPQSMAAVTTHDLPTVAGLWTGSDLETQRRLGLQPNEKSTLAIRRRLADEGRLRDDAGAEEAVLAAHALLARAPSVLLSATLDDALVEEERPNIPGGDGMRPNWSLALPRPLEEIEHLPLVQRIARALAEATREPEV